MAWPVEGGKIEPRKFNYEQLNDLFTSIMTSKAKLVAQRGDVDKPAKDAQDKLNEYVKEQLPGLASKDLVHAEREHEEARHSPAPGQRESQSGHRSTTSAARAWWIAASPATSAPIRCWFPSR